MIVFELGVQECHQGKSSRAEQVAAGPCLTTGMTSPNSVTEAVCAVAAQRASLKPQSGQVGKLAADLPGPGALLLGSRWWGRIWPGSASELVTLVVTTSPIPSHPSLVLLRTESASAMACPCNMASDMQAHLLYHIPDYIRLSIDYHDMSVFVHAARQCTTYHVSDLVMFGI